MTDFKNFFTITGMAIGGEVPFSANASKYYTGMTERVDKGLFNIQCQYLSRKCKSYDKNVRYKL